MFLLNYRWGYYTLMEDIKTHHEGEKQEAYTHIANTQWLANNQILGCLGGERKT
jgi:hypothetical protein